MRCANAQKKLINMKTKNQELEAMLESDDELPSDYEEVLEIPAYKIDNRFEKMQFGWIDSNFSKYYQKKSAQLKANLSVLYSTLNEDHLRRKTANLAPGEKCLILNGVLAVNDIYCLKSIEPTSSDSLFLWFINYLFYKDLQSNYSFLKTCLVSACQVQLNEQATQIYADYKNYNFDIMIK